jgi:hypothetical protein
MKYFKLIYDYKNDDDVICCTQKDMYGIDRYDVIKGEEINCWSESISFSYNPYDGKNFTDFLANDLNWFMVSQAFKEILEKNKIGGLQYLPIIILNDVTEEIIKNYYLTNVCNLIDALDLENSKFSIYTNIDGSNLISVNVYALKNDIIKDIDIFRIKDNNIPIFVSDKLRKIIRKNKITGCDFVEVKVI